MGSIPTLVRVFLCPCVGLFPSVGLTLTWFIWERNLALHIYPLFDYCNSLLYGQPKCSLQRLQSVLNSAARLIHLSSRYEHVTPLLIQLHWLPIEQRITFKIAVITFKALHGSASDYITKLIKPYIPSRSLRSSNKLLLFKPRFNLKTYGGRSFTMATPSVWNTLPLELRSCCSLSSFKSKLKTLFFKASYDVVL